MKIVGVTACTAGIAHTYIVKEKLEQAARKLGYTCRIETQGSIMSTEKAMKNTGAMLQSIEEALTKKKNGGN